MNPYKIMIADDHKLFRELIKRSLQEIPDFAIVGEGGDCSELMDLVETTSCDLVILDIGMPRGSGLDVAKWIKTSHPDIEVLILTMHKSMDHLKAAMKAKADGYLLKEDAFQELIVAINSIRKGNNYISPLLSKVMADHFMINMSKPANSKLSSREIEVIKLFSEGKSVKEIAELLVISWSTARNHLHNLKRKLSIKRNIDLVKYAIKEGYIK
ncbi:MAG: response regulator transcription factor [Syntrophobacterales bacterium]|jgi:DNA-binding NarL/FixJ family response regulator|nr:response regulator transcription factor [Syntrophobacterales bacterium]